MKRRSLAILLASITIGTLALTAGRLPEKPSVQPTSTPEDHYNPGLPYPPSDIQAGRAKNSALLETEYIDVLQWQPNPRNVGVGISAYRVYRFENGHRSLLDEVVSTAYEYWVRGTTEDVTKYYGITSKARDGRESAPVVITIQAREHR